MRFCNKCKHLNAGKNPYCQHCGSTFNVKLCPRMHPSPRAAQYCAECGSSELSTPQPKVPILGRPFVFLLELGPGILLLLMLCSYLMYFVYRLIEEPNGLLQPMVIGLLLGLLLFGWMNLHSRVRKWRSGFGGGNKFRRR